MCLWSCPYLSLDNDGTCRRTGPQLLLQKQELFQGCERLGFSVNSDCYVTIYDGSYVAKCDQLLKRVLPFLRFFFFFSVTCILLKSVQWIKHLRTCSGRLVLFMLSESVKLDSLIDWNRENYLRLYMFVLLKTKKSMQIHKSDQRQEWNVYKSNADLIATWK